MVKTSKSQRHIVRVELDLSVLDSGACEGFITVKLASLIPKGKSSGCKFPE